MKKFDKIMLGVSNFSILLLTCTFAAGFIVRAFPKIEIEMFSLTTAIIFLVAAIKHAFDNFPINKEKGEGGKEV